LASFNAFHYALKIAGQFSSRVILYHASNVPVATPHVGVPLHNNALDEAEQRAWRYLEELEYSVPPDIARHIELEFHTNTKEVEHGIAEMCQKHNPSLMVMGMKVRGAIAGALMGSTVSRILGKGDCPILVVPEGAHYQPIKHIAYGSLFETEEQPTIDRLLEFAFLNEAVIHCVHVKTKNEKDEHLDVKLDGLMGLYRDDIILNQIEVATITYTDALEGLLNYIEQNEVGMLALHMRKRSFWSNMFNPSLCKRIVFLSKIPILVFQR
jgi:nucleotide-binding universal stress UspA family protein